MDIGKSMDLKRVREHTMIPGGYWGIGTLQEVIPTSEYRTTVAKLLDSKVRYDGAKQDRGNHHKGNTWLRGQKQISMCCCFHTAMYLRRSIIQFITFVHVYIIHFTLIHNYAHCGIFVGVLKDTAPGSRGVQGSRVRE